MSFNLGFIGGGNMSTAIFKGILNNGVHPVSKIWVSGPQIQHLTHWTEQGANVTTKNGEVISNCDVVFLGVKPGMLTSAIDDCLKTLPMDSASHNILFVSMLAGKTIGELQKVLSALTKTVNVIRIMPNIPMTVGAGVCLYTPNDNVVNEQCVMLEKLLKGCALCEKVPEYLMDPLGSMIACGPAYIFVVIEALADGAVKQGVSRDVAIRMAAQMVMGSGKMVVQTGKHPAVLKDEVCSPGGTTICGVSTLENGNIRAAFINAVEASTQRSKELGKK